MSNPGLKQGQSPIEILGLLAIVTAGALILGLFLPGFTAYLSGVFSEDEMRCLVFDRFPQTWAAVDRFERSQDELHMKLAQVDQLLLDASLGGGKYDRSTLIAEQIRYQTELQSSRPPVSIQPFYLHIVMYFWPTMYLCLGIILVLLKPPGVRMFRVSKTTFSVFLTTVGIVVLYVGPLWLRNVAFNTPSYWRVVYAYPNKDISEASFYVQLLNYLIFSFLLALLWHQWSDYFVLRRDEIRSEPHVTGLEATFDPHRLDRFSKALLHWQVSFAILSVGFVIYTAIFWKQIIRVGDWRFLPEAIMVHLLWLVSAVVIAMPFWITWRAWRSDHVRATSELIHAPDSEHLDAKLTALREFRPIGSWNVAALTVTLLSSFAAPLIQFLMKSFENR